MAETSDQVRKRGGAAALLLAGTVTLLALPSAVLALSTRLDLQPVVVEPVVPSGFRAAEVDPRLARSITVRALSQGRTFRFTPAATPTRMDRSLTVAVRLFAPTNRPIVVRAPSPGAGQASAISIAPAAYSLKATRGYKSFAQNGVSDASRIDMPDLAAYSIRGGAASDPSRFAPRIELDEKDRAGRSPRTLEGQGSDQTVDLGGSYRLSRSMNVTAGVRYSSERNRIDPLVDGKQDNQAVYVGTQIKF
ncbi:hypothetical protein B0I00_1539 [Novosphingobium kunmingense]|uniref:Porin n=1 Tax=Novosphingobium kunmingense TaxID=1211806 RepID=A0A2N0HKB3_9SPHN|nr:hypothetical protein B0I00_1539 [Novosphingobium kunmingense]